MKSLLRVLRYFRADAGAMGFAVSLLLLSSSASLLKPWPLAVIVDSVLGHKPLPAWLVWASGWNRTTLLASLGAAILVLYAGQGALAAWQNYISIQIGLRGLVRVRKEVFLWVERLSLRFHQGRSQGDLIYRMSWDTYAFQTLFQQGIFTLSSALLSLLLMFIVMWRLNRPLATVALLVVPVLVLSMKSLGRGMNRRSLAAHQADSQVTSSIQQTITALPVIQSYTREEAEHRRFGAQVDEAYRRRVSQHGWEVLYWLAIAVGFGLAAAGLTWLGAKQVQAGRLTIGEMLVFLGYLTQLYEPLNQLSHVGATVSNASAGTERVLELLDSPLELADSPTARAVVDGRVRHPEAALAEPKPTLTASRPSLLPVEQTEPLHALGNISFLDVSFGYEKDRLVLQGLTFSVRAGESVAIVGPSGAGKTTLLQLLPRFYDPSTGSVWLDGIELPALRLKDLRTQIALVPQEPSLLLASIAENIAYGKPGASLAEIQAAAEEAHADEFILKLPQKYDTLVGEGAARLSVGEKQRISLARAFLKDAPILVLDEPTSALDLDSEELVVQSLARLMRNRTAFLVAHRLSTIRAVDRILVLAEGRIIESGSPTDLLQAGGYYARVAVGQLRID